MNVNDIIDLVTGKNEITQENTETTAKSVVSVLLATVDENGENKKEIESQSILNPEVQIRNILDNIMIDIIFNSEMDIDLKEMWKIAEQYLIKMNDYSRKEDDSKNIPVLNFMFMPTNEAGHCFVQAINPTFFTLTPTIPGGQCCCLRLMFAVDNVDVYSSEDMDLSDIDVNAEIEFQKRSHLETRDAQRKQQRKEYMEELEYARKKQM